MIATTDLSRQWGDFRLEGVSLRVESGEYFVILGPCGCGKTLLLETIAGLHQPYAGSVYLDGEQVDGLPPEKRRVGLVYQQLCLFPHLSVRDNIAYGLRYVQMGQRQRRQRVDEMIDLLGLGSIAARPSPVGLSGGESQKVALARALAVQPDVLLLDEPLSSLDYVSRNRIAQILREINEDLGVTIIHVTHDYTEAAAVGHRIAVMAEGEIRQTGSVEEVFWKPRDRFVAEFLGVENLLEGVAEQAPDGALCITVGSLQLCADADGLRGPVMCTVRPEDLVLRTNGGSGGPNRFGGIVREVRDLGFHVRMTIDIRGVEMTAQTPRSAYREAPCTVGDRVDVELPADAIHVFRETEDAA